MATSLRAAGAQCRRIGFNRADALFWGSGDYQAFGGSLEDWPERFKSEVTAQGTTDLVLYGDTRPLHASALKIARRLGLACHVFEEGYIRPYWVTYERGGANGHSRALGFSMNEMARHLGAPGGGPSTALGDVPAHWGDMREHIFWGAVYHACLLAGSKAYPHYRGHRCLTVPEEFRLYLRRLGLLAPQIAERWYATGRLRQRAPAYHLVLLQLAHDESFRRHGPFETQEAFLRTVMRGFSEGARKDHHLVFKAHPLEDGRNPVRRMIAALAAEQGLARRVHYIRGGKLAGLLNGTRSAVTVNSTAAHQALWRGLPVKAFGQSVYSRTSIVSSQSLPAFFAEPDAPDPMAYAILRAFLLATSQVPGGYYSSGGRRRLMEAITKRVLSPVDPYDYAAIGHAANWQHSTTPALSGGDIALAFSPNSDSL
ncbi:MAG: capsule biosynthesis protein CapA [Pseudomonadota bacterium]